MAKILVHHEGTQFGPYEEDEVRQYIYAGRFRDSDLAWREGLPTWVPLGALLASGAATPAAGAIPAPAPASYPAHYPSSIRFYKETSPLAISSLVLGIISLIGCMIITGIPGVICGHLALSKIRRSNGYVTGEGIAIAGLVMSYMAVFITLAGFLLFFLLPAIFAIAAQTLHAF